LARQSFPTTNVQQIIGLTHFARPLAVRPHMTMARRQLAQPLPDRFILQIRARRERKPPTSCRVWPRAGRWIPRTTRAGFSIRDRAWRNRRASRLLATDDVEPDVAGMIPMLYIECLFAEGAEMMALFEPMIQKRTWGALRRRLQRLRSHADRRCESRPVGAFRSAPAFATEAQPGFVNRQLASSLGFERD